MLELFGVILIFYILFGLINVISDNLIEIRDILKENYESLISKFNQIFYPKKYNLKILHSKKENLIIKIKECEKETLHYKKKIAQEREIQDQLKKFEEYDYNQNYNIKLSINEIQRQKSRILSKVNFDFSPKLSKKNYEQSIVEVKNLKKELIVINNKIEILEKEKSNHINNGAIRLKNRYKTLINLIMKRSSFYKMEEIDFNKIKLQEEDIIFNLTQIHNKLYIEWHRHTPENEYYNLEWNFDEFDDQNKIYEKLDRGITQHYLDNEMTMFHFGDENENLICNDENVENRTKKKENIKQKYEYLISCFDDFDIYKLPQVLNDEPEYYKIGWFNKTSIMSMTFFYRNNNFYVEYNLDYNYNNLKKLGYDTINLPKIKNKIQWDFDPNESQLFMSKKITDDINKTI